MTIIFNRCIIKSSNKERGYYSSKGMIMNNLISKERLIDTLYDFGFQVLSEQTMKSTIVFETIMKCINCIESQPVVYSVEKAQEDIDRIKAKEQLFDVNAMDLNIPQHFTKEQAEWIKKYCIQKNMSFYNKAIDDFVNYANTCPDIEEEDYIRGMSLEEMGECCKIK